MDAPRYSEFLNPAKLLAGPCALNHLPLELSALGILHPLILTDASPAAAKALPLLHEALGNSRLCFGSCAEVPTVPDSAWLKSLETVIREQAFDGLIVLGGGPVLETSQAASLALAVAGQELHLVYLPFLDGSGFEATGRFFRDGTLHADVALAPRLIVIDPRTAVMRDRKETASSSLTALVQALEVLLCPDRTPFAAAYAAASLRLLTECLLPVLQSTRDDGARVSLATALAWAGCAYANTVPGIVFALGLGLARYSGLPAGLCMALLLPAALRSQPLPPEEAESALLPMLGLEGFCAVAPEDRSERLSWEVEMLLERIKTLVWGGAPKSLAEIFPDRDILALVIEEAVVRSGASFDRDLCRSLLDGIWKERGA